MSTASRLAALAAACALLPAAGHAATPAERAVAVANAARVQLEWGVRIPLRDGVHLNATVYRPTATGEPQPCVFTLTPYISQSYHDRGMYFAAHGYPFLTIDVRGRGNSEGTFRPFLQEGRDGYDVVEWLAKQPYCNGKVAMWGGSYAGYDQWLTARERPPHLATIVPVAAPYAGVDFPGRNSVPYPPDIQWLALVSGRAAQDALYEDQAFWTSVYRRWYESGAPYRTLDRVAGMPSPIFQEWLAHPDVDAYWDAYNPADADYAQLTLPILTITGMYDDDQPGALEHYARYMKAADAAGRARHLLVIGPWDHAGTRTPLAEFGGLRFGPASLVDLPQLHLDWYRYAMQGGPRPAFLQGAVNWYVTGAERWRHADSLEAVTAASKPWFLDSAGEAARELYAAGSLSPAHRGHGAPDRYVYEPRDLGYAAAEAGSDAQLLLDPQLINANPAKLVYVSAPLEADTELAGFFRLTAWLGIDQPDTDFVARVIEITADGAMVPLASDVQRARYRQGTRTPRPLRTRAAERYQFDHFTFCARLVRRGSRLLLVVSAANSIYQQKNYNAGGVVADESVRDARPVVVRLYHDSGRPSALYVPYAAADAAAAH